MASLIDKERLNDEFAFHCGFRQDGSCTSLEKAAILSVVYANKEAQIDLSSERTIFILSTTKGNVDLLDMRLSDMRYETSQISYLKSQIYLWHTAELITKFFKNPNTPIVVSVACISGAAAQIVAMRELKSGNYDHAVVVGVDLLSKFIISGFQSFKALSPTLCQPFDKNRCGLNLGEAAATMIFRHKILDMRCETQDVRQSDVRCQKSQIPYLKSHISLVAGTVRNDSCHISAPSRTGEGSLRALSSILNTQISNPKSQIPNLKSQISNPKSQIPNLTSQIAFINAHGTATPYNDAMEMNAIVRSGLQHIPVNSLKSYFGHTLGAAGVVESVISMKALNEGLILKTLGFEESEQFPPLAGDLGGGKQLTLNVCKENMKTDKKCFIKMMSGFGGVNAALLFATDYTN